MARISRIVLASAVATVSLAACGSDEPTTGPHGETIHQLGEVADAGGTYEGKAVLLLPGDERMLEPVEECATPAYVAVTADDELGSDRTALVRLPDAVVEKANELRVEHNQG